MKQLNLSYRELSNLDFTNTVIKNLLLNEGFDFSKTVRVYDDFMARQIIYTQQ